MNLDNASVYDEECFPNIFTLSMEMLNSSIKATWEISDYRDDRRQLFEWLEWLRAVGGAMIGFNNLGYDYIILHYLMINRNATAFELYQKSMSIINSQNDNRFGQTIWADQRFITQIDLFKIHHFDNKAKTTSLKALEINMRAPRVVECPLPFGEPVSFTNVPVLIGYNQHDVTWTKQFAKHSMPAIDFRIGLIPQFGLEVLNYNDVKIGVKMLEKRLGDDVCYTRDENGRKQKRQTIRRKIALSEIIFPYINFHNPEFRRVLDFMKTQVLTPEDLDDPDAEIKTKGVFKNVIANVGGLDFYFGTGGVHASVSSQRFESSDTHQIVDIDVAALYPNVAIVNGLAPEHLGPAFVAEYAKIPIERNLHAKGTVENATLKLASNGPWGQSNNKFSVFLDSKYAMTIPINGQLMICMLAEYLVTVPTLKLIQANTDGITYYIHKDHIPAAKAIEDQWQAFTCLTLEYAQYRRMWIRDVNNYIAEDMKGKLKQKGAYWHPEPGEGYADSISKASPPCWYKDLGNIVSVRAAIAAMVHGIDPETFIKLHVDRFDFCLRTRAKGQDRLYLGGRPVQSTLRYYVAKNGEQLIKKSPPTGPMGSYKKANGISDAAYNQRMAETGGEWCGTVCTKNKSRHVERINAIEAGWKIAECNDIEKLTFDNINYDWYIQETRKLLIGGL